MTVDSDRVRVRAKKWLQTADDQKGRLGCKTWWREESGPHGGGGSVEIKARMVGVNIKAQQTTQGNKCLSHTNCRS